jgi:hypothetical protein
MSGVKRSRGDYKQKKGNREAPAIRHLDEDNSLAQDDGGVGNEADWVPAAASVSVDQVRFE